MKTWKTWTVKEIRRLEELRLGGMKAPAIARQLGRTLASVKCRLCQEGIYQVGAYSHWLRVLNRPHTIAGAAREMNVTKWAVKQAKRRLRLGGCDIPAALRETRPLAALDVLEDQP